jgi:hypothetical protein
MIEESSTQLFKGACFCESSPSQTSDNFKKSNAFDSIVQRLNIEEKELYSDVSTSLHRILRRGNGYLNIFCHINRKGTKAADIQCSFVLKATKNGNSATISEVNLEHSCQQFSNRSAAGDTQRQRNSKLSHLVTTDAPSLTTYVHPEKNASKKVTTFILRNHY